MITDLFTWIVVVFMSIVLLSLIGTVLLGEINTRRKTKKGEPGTLFGVRQIREWERIFSWRPVRTIDKGWVWLRFYWRRQIYTPASVDGVFEESYHYQNVIQIAWYTY
jgi:hypothetical protein